MKTGFGSDVPRLPVWVAAILALLGGCAETSAALATARTGTCLVCAKLQDLGVCEPPCQAPCPGGEVGADAGTQ